MKIFSYFSSILLRIFCIKYFYEQKWKDRCAFPYFGTFSKFCWNKLYILGCLYIVYNILDIWTLCGVAKNNTGHCTWPENDADQQYDRPTVIQLIQTGRGCTDIWGFIWTWEIYLLGGIWMYGVIWT